MGIKFSNNALTTLYQSIGATDIVLQVAPNKGDNFSALTGGSGDYTVITMEDANGNREFIRVNHRPAGSDVLGSVSYPLVRGYWGSTARAWAAGDSVDNRVTAEALEALTSGGVDANDAQMIAMFWG